MLIYINMYICLLYRQGERERETGSLFRVSMHFQPTNEFCGMLYSSISGENSWRKAGFLLNAGAFRSCPFSRCKVEGVHSIWFMFVGWTRQEGGIQPGEAMVFSRWVLAFGTSRMAWSSQEARFNFIFVDLRYPSAFNGKIKHCSHPVSAPWNFHFPKKTPSTS